MREKTTSALFVRFQDFTAVVFPQGDCAFGTVIDSNENKLDTIVLHFASGQRVGDCEVYVFGDGAGKFEDWIEYSTECRVVYREGNFLIPSGLKQVKLGGFRFGDSVVTQVKQFVRFADEC